MFKERTTLTEEEIKIIEEKIGYEFKNKGLLIQAFTRRSFGTEHDVPDNEMLELIGDRALDYVVLRNMLTYCEIETIDNIQDNHKERVTFNEVSFSVMWPHNTTLESIKNKAFSEEIITNSKKALVSKNNLSRCMDELKLQNYLIINKADITNEVYNTKSVKEDLLEAIIGAVAIDSEWNYDSLLECVGNMVLENSKLFYDVNSNKVTMEEVNLSDEVIDFVQEWFQENLGKLPNYTYEKYKSNYVCTLSINEKSINYSCDGRPSPSKKEARINCAMEFANYILKYMSFINEHEILGLKNTDEFQGATIDNAINLLQEAEQKGVIPKISYSFDCKYDSNGNPLWRCMAKFKVPDGIREMCVEPYAESKKVAKKNTAYSLIEKFTVDAFIHRRTKNRSMPSELFRVNVDEYIYSGEHNTFYVIREFLNGEELQSHQGARYEQFR